MAKQNRGISIGNPKLLNVEFTNSACKEFEYWTKHDKPKQKKIFSLINESRRTPFQDTGKPERLKHQINNIRSRRIDLEHRLVYAVDDDRLTIIQCRFHY